MLILSIILQTSMVSILVSLKYDGDETDDSNRLSLLSRLSRAPRREKESKPIMYFLHLSCLVTSSNIHFAKYCEGRKQVTQLVSSFVWKKVFKQYKNHYIKFHFVAITNHLTNDFSKKKIVKIYERYTNAQTNIIRIQLEKHKGQFIKEKKILQNVKIRRKKTRDLQMISEETYVVILQKYKKRQISLLMNEFIEPPSTSPKLPCDTCVRGDHWAHIQAQIFKVIKREVCKIFKLYLSCSYTS